jgi:hypothetical protein
MAPAPFTANDWLTEIRPQRDGVTVPVFWVAIALSILLHLAIMSGWRPDLNLRADQREIPTPLIVQLDTPPRPPPAPAYSPPPAPAAPARPSQAAPRPKAAPPPVLALKRPAPGIQTPVPATPSPPATAPRPPEADLASYIESRRKARGENAPPAAGNPSRAPPVEDDNARSNRLAAANLASGRPQTFGYDPNKSGGVFQVDRLGSDYAEFMFYGWNKEFKRNTAQRIEVSRGSNSDIRLAVVRRMISIIREYEQDEFLWESRRLGRNLTLSARARDNAGLEEFMMREFFPEVRAVAR